MAGDGLVLCAVVHILSADVLHKAYQSHISHENSYLDHTLDNGADNAALLYARDESNYPLGEENKQSDSHSHTDDYAYIHENIVSGAFLFLVFSVPGRLRSLLSGSTFLLSLFLRLFFLLHFFLIGKLLVSGLHHILIALYKGGDEAGAASHEGSFLIPGSVLSVILLPGLKVDSTVRETAGHCPFMNPLHHDPFDQRLTADF